MDQSSIVSLVFEGFNKRDFAGVQPYMDENIRFHFPGVGEISGAKRVLVFLKTLLRKYSELRFYISEIIQSDNRAVAVWTNSGLKISGERYSNSGITLFHFEEGKIVFLSDYFKDTSFVSEK